MQPKKTLNLNPHSSHHVEYSNSTNSLYLSFQNKFAGASRSEEFHKEAMKKYARGVDLPSKESLEVTFHNAHH